MIIAVANIIASFTTTLVSLLGAAVCKVAEAVGSIIIATNVVVVATSRVAEEVGDLVANANMLIMAVCMIAAVAYMIAMQLNSS